MQIRSFKLNKIILAGIGLVAVILFSFSNLYQNANLERRTLELTQIINSLRLYDVLMQQQISFDFRRQNYDKLNMLENRFLSLWKRTRSEINLNFVQDKQIISSIEALDASIKLQSELILQYESDKAVLTNSLFYIIQLQSTLNEQTHSSFNKQYAAYLDAIIKNSTYYNANIVEIKANVDETLLFLAVNKTNTVQTSLLTKRHLIIFYEKTKSIHDTLKQLKALNNGSKLENLEAKFFEIVETKRATSKTINIFATLFSLVMLLGFLYTFFKIYNDKQKILKLQDENNKNQQQLLAHIQLLDQYKKAMDESSIVSKTNLNGIITYVNQKFCDITGYTKEELIGKPHNIIRHPDTPKEVFKELWKTIKNKNIFHAIIKNKTKNGSFYYVDSTIVPILNLQGEVSEYFGMRNDVTELIKAKEEALSAERAKSAFLATMGHELRTPLNAVIGFSQILMSKNDMPLEKVHSFVEKIHLSGRHLLSIVNNILDFSKMEAENMELSKQEVDLNTLVIEAITLVETTANHKKIRIKKENFVAKTVFGDAQLLKQVLLNILSNALKFTPENASITLTCKDSATEHIISICDEGIGLSQEQIKNLFKPFSQIKEHQNEAIKGTGLGLAISKKIIELHHGKIEVQSTLGAGSCFIIYLPKENK